MDEGLRDILFSDVLEFIKYMRSHADDGTISKVCVTPKLKSWYCLHVCALAPKESSWRRQFKVTKTIKCPAWKGCACLDGYPVGPGALSMQDISNWVSLGEFMGCENDECD